RERRYRTWFLQQSPGRSLLECYEDLAQKFPQGLAGLPELPEELSGAVLKAIQSEKDIETAQAGREANMTAIFFVLLSWGILTAKTRRQMIAVATAGAVAVMLVSPPRVYAQGLWAAIQAVLKVINGIIQTALNSINTVRSAINQFYQLTVWPQQLTNQARSLVTQMINQYRAPMAAIFNIPLQSARLASTQQLEVLMRNA